MTTWTRIRLPAALAVVALGLGCAPARPDYREEAPMDNVPFSAVGWTAAGGFSTGIETYQVGATLIRVEDDAYSKPIRDHWTRIVLAGLPEQDGYVGHGVTVRNAEGGGFGDDGQWAWTYTVWRDEAAMDGFVGSDLHQQGLPELGPVITDFSSGRWEANAGEIPQDWDTIWTRLAPR